MLDTPHRIHRREFKDYQPLLMLLQTLDIVDDDTRQDFACVTGAVWRAFTLATKGAQRRRLTALFAPDGLDGFASLLFVGCDFVRRRQHQSRALWSAPAWDPAPSDAAVARLCIGFAGRLVLTQAHLADLPAAARAGSPPLPRCDEGLRLG